MRRLPTTGITTAGGRPRRPGWRLRLAIAGAIVSLVLIPASTIASSAITGSDSGSFTLGSHEVGYPANTTFSVSVAPGSLVDSGIARLAPGASFGWHYHNSAVVVTVTRGSLTVYDPSCDRQVVAAGQGFIEEPDVVHLARNESSSTVVILWTYLGVPAGQPEDVYEPPSYDPCGGIR